MTKRVVLVIFLFVSLLFTSCAKTDPPVGEILERDPQTYLETNQYVSNLRKDLQQKGFLHTHFLPNEIDNETDVSYLYWYHCAFLGNPKYAITLSVSYPDQEGYSKEYERLSKLDDISLLRSGDVTIIGYNAIPKVLDYCEPPLRDGREYTMEYAIAS